MIEFSEKTRMVWYQDMPGGNNWMGAIEAEEGGTFKIIYRFRYRKDEKAFDSIDERNWYTGRANDYGRAADLVRHMLQLSAELPGGFEKPYIIERGTGTLKQFMEEFLKLPFVHAKVEKIIDPEKENRST
jgi:hypothetical protein